MRVRVRVIVRVHVRVRVCVSVCFPFTLFVMLFYYSKESFLEDDLSLSDRMDLRFLGYRKAVRSLITLVISPINIPNYPVGFRKAMSPSASSHLIYACFPRWFVPVLSMCISIIYLSIYLAI